MEKAPPQIMPLRILSGKGAVQIMPFRKLGGKCHFLLRFCTRKRSETYTCIPNKYLIPTKAESGSILLNLPNLPDMPDLVELLIVKKNLKYTYNHTEIQPYSEMHMAKTLIQEQWKLHNALAFLKLITV